MAKSRFFDRALSQLDEMLGEQDGEPMEIMRGADGRIEGARQAGRELRVVRDGNGRPVSIEMVQ